METKTQIYKRDKHRSTAIRFTTEVYDQLDFVSQELLISVSEVIRRYCARGLESDGVTKIAVRDMEIQNE